MILNPEIKDIEFQDLMAIDLETTGLNPRQNNISAICLVGSEVYVIECMRYKKDELLELFQQLSKIKVLVAHNAKFDGGFIYGNYDVLLNNLWCTMLASQICSNGKKQLHSLDVVLERYLGIRLENKKAMQKSFIGHKGELTAAQVAYVVSDTKHLLQLYKVLLKEIQGLELQNVVLLENSLLACLISMEVRGCRIDTQSWQSQIETWETKLFNLELAMDKELVKLSKEYEGIRGGIYTRKRNKVIVEQTSLFSNSTYKENDNTGNVNYSSSKQVLDIFVRMKLPVPKNAEGSLSVDETTLKYYLTQNPCSPLKEFISYLYDYKEFNKLLSTYGDKFLSKLENSYVFSTYTQCFTETGRLSSTNLNLQNVPQANKEKGYNLRKCFVPDTDCYLVTYDLSGAELRIAADFSQDELVLANFAKGAKKSDLHSILASSSFSIIFEQDFTVDKSELPVKVKHKEYVPERLRNAHKPVLFGKIYTAGAGKIYQLLADYINEFHPEPDRLNVAKKISQAFDKKLPKLTEFLRKHIDLANTPRLLNGKQERYLKANSLGRIRFFDEGAFGEAANYRIQATCADAMKLAMVKAHKYLTETGYGRVTLSVHDELVCNVKKEYIDEASPKLKEIMESSLSFFLKTIKAESDGGYSEYWEK